MHGATWLPVVSSSVDVRIHHVVDACKFDPGTFEGNPAEYNCIRSRENCTEKHTGRTVQLRNNNPFSPIDHKCTRESCRDIQDKHPGWSFQSPHVPDHTIKFNLLLGERCRSDRVQYILNRVTRRVDEIIQKFQHEIYSGHRKSGISVKTLYNPSLTLFSDLSPVGKILKGFTWMSRKSGYSALILVDQSEFFGFFEAKSVY